MKQTIEIEVPDGKKAVWKNNKVVFEDIKSQLPKTWEKFCESSVIDKEYIIGTGSIIIECKNTFRYANNNKNLLPSEEAAKAHLALMQLHQLRDCYRQGWKPDWGEDNYKYCIVKNEDCYKIVTYTKLVKFLSFQTQELAQQFFDNFKDLIKQAGDLI